MARTGYCPGWEWRNFLNDTRRMSMFNFLKDEVIVISAHGGAIDNAQQLNASGFAFDRDLQDTVEVPRGVEVFFEAAAGEIGYAWEHDGVQDEDGNLKQNIVFPKVGKLNLATIPVGESNTYCERQECANYKYIRPQPPEHWCDQAGVFLVKQGNWEDLFENRDEWTLKDVFDEITGWRWSFTSTVKIYVAACRVGELIGV